MPKKEQWQASTTKPQKSKFVQQRKVWLYIIEFFRNLPKRYWKNYDEKKAVAV